MGEKLSSFSCSGTVQVPKLQALMVVDLMKKGHRILQRLAQGPSDDQDLQVQGVSQNPTTRKGRRASPPVELEITVSCSSGTLGISPA